MDFSHNMNGSTPTQPNGLHHNFPQPQQQQQINGSSNFPHMFGNNNNINANNGSNGREKSIVESVESIVESLRLAVVVIEEFQAEKGQTLLYQHMGNIVEEFKQLESHRSDNEILIPVEILSYIDQGKNPDLYIKESLEACLRANERTNGKIEALQTFRDELETQIQELYPAAHSVYRPPTTQNGEL